MTEQGAEPPAGAPAIRASDADRERVADVVRRAVGDGRLTVVEGDERQTRAYGAVYRTSSPRASPTSSRSQRRAPLPAPLPSARRRKLSTRSSEVDQ